MIVLRRTTGLDCIVIASKLGYLVHLPISHVRKTISQGPSWRQALTSPSFFYFGLALHSAQVLPTIIESCCYFP